ncbi:hypothetical protein PR048_028559 [Dryococelus australis]|uniref:Uncharacterized protein n=1 Tax=Dryococelus australis TaxID=614101 RepID=A0ABQ9GBC2_9NEOP|nr:hypothetical protein PR048_028559 [Dryococelus australis]
MWSLAYRSSNSRNVPIPTYSLTPMPYLGLKPRASRTLDRLLASRRDDPGAIPGRVTPDFRMWESCRTMPLVGGVFFSGISRFPCPLHSGAAPYSPHSPTPALKTSVSITCLLDFAVLCTLEPQMFVHWLLSQRVASVNPHLAVDESLGDALPAPRDVDGEDAQLQDLADVGEEREDVGLAFHPRQQVENLAELGVLALGHPRLHLGQVPRLVQAVQAHANQLPGRRDRHERQPCAHNAQRLHFRCPTLSSIVCRLSGQKDHWLSLTGTTATARAFRATVASQCRLSGQKAHWLSLTGTTATARAFRATMASQCRLSGQKAHWLSLTGTTATARAFRATVASQCRLSGQKAHWLSLTGTTATARAFRATVASQCRLSGQKAHWLSLTGTTATARAFRATVASQCRLSGQKAHWLSLTGTTATASAFRATVASHMSTRRTHNRALQHVCPWRLLVVVSVSDGVGPVCVGEANKERKCSMESRSGLGQSDGHVRRRDGPTLGLWYGAHKLHITIASSIHSRENGEYVVHPRRCQFSLATIFRHTVGTDLPARLCATTGFSHKIVQLRPQEMTLKRLHLLSESQPTVSLNWFISSVVFYHVRNCLSSRALDIPACSLFPLVGMCSFEVTSGGGLHGHLRRVFVSLHQVTFEFMETNTDKQLRGQTRRRPHPIRQRARGEYNACNRGAHREIATTTQLRNIFSDQAAMPSHRNKRKKEEWVREGVVSTPCCYCRQPSRLTLILSLSAAIVMTRERAEFQVGGQDVACPFLSVTLPAGGSCSAGSPEFEILRLPAKMLHTRGGLKLENQSATCVF